MSSHPLDVYLTNIHSTAPIWDDHSQEQLQDFLEAVANTPLKVKILQLFLSDPGLCLSSSVLADRIEQPPFETRQAVQQLNRAGALNYSPHFAFTDLCSLSISRLPEAMRQQLCLFQVALRRQPETVWGYFNANDQKEPERNTQLEIQPHLQSALHF